MYTVKEKVEVIVFVGISVNTYVHVIFLVNERVGYTRERSKTEIDHHQL